MSSSTDPLERRWLARLLVLAVCLAMLVTFVLGVRGGDDEALPALALDSRLVLGLERATLVGVLVAATAIFVLRGWSGYFPVKLSTAGAEYEARPIFSELAAVDSSTENAIDELRHREEQLALYLDGLASRLEALEMNRGDML